MQFCFAPLLSAAELLTLAAHFRLEIVKPLPGRQLHFIFVSGQLRASQNSFSPSLAKSLAQPCSMDRLKDQLFITGLSV